MEPIGPLMWEHRTIERAVNLLEQELEWISDNRKLNPKFLESVVDFFRMYADRTHHGKEEDILFKELSTKSLLDEHKKTMDELKDDHVRGRELIKQISDVLENRDEENAKSLDIVTKAIKGLLALYPQHIEKEDEHFFYPVMDYFTDEEKENMLQEFYEFDRQLIHERYKTMLEEMEKTY